jgi:hypothetical protein
MRGRVPESQGLRGSPSLLILLLFALFGECRGIIRSNVILADCWEERTVCARDYHPADLHEAITAEDARERRQRRPTETPHSEEGVEGDDPLSCQRTVRRQLAQAMIPGPALVSITMDRSAYRLRTQTPSVPT